jgi:hypothetical protein
LTGKPENKEFFFVLWFFLWPGKGGVLWSKVCVPAEKYEISHTSLRIHKKERFI